MSKIETLYEHSGNCALISGIGTLTLVLLIKTLMVAGALSCGNNTCEFVGKIGLSISLVSTLTCCALYFYNEVLSEHFKRNTS